jgi:AraC family transcriptional regulator
VILTLGGEGRFRLASGRGVLRPGDLWIVPAGEPQEYGTDAEWRILFFHISAALPGGTIPFAAPTCIRASFPTQLESAMTCYLTELILDGARSREIARSYAEVIRICLDRELDASSLPERSRTRVRLDELRQEISGNMGRNWTVDEMARRLGLSISQFRRVVIAQQGCAPQDMLVRMRIERAQQLLIRTDDTLAIIAERIGYESPFSLSRAFHRVVGVSPRQYRRQNLPTGGRDDGAGVEHSPPRTGHRAGARTTMRAAARQGGRSRVD